MTVRISKAEARKLGIVSGADKSAGKVETRLSQAAGLHSVIARQAGTPSFLLRLMTYKMPRCRLGPEDREAKVFSDQLRAWTLEGKLKAVWWHTASELAGGGGKASQIRYAIAKALGLIPGSPDYVFMHPKKGGFALEMKAPKGVMSNPQKDFRSWCEQTGIPYETAFGSAQAISQIRKWGLLEEEAADKDARGERAGDEKAAEPQPAAGDQSGDT